MAHSPAHSPRCGRPPLVPIGEGRHNGESGERTLARTATPIGRQVHRVANFRRAESPTQVLRRDATRCRSATRIEDERPAKRPAACRCASDSASRATARRATSKSPTKPRPNYEFRAIQKWSITDLNSSTNRSYGALRSARRHARAAEPSHIQFRIRGLSDVPNVLNQSPILTKIGRAATGMTPRS